MSASFPSSKGDPVVKCFKFADNITLAVTALFLTGAKDGDYAVFDISPFVSAKSGRRKTKFRFSRDVPSCPTLFLSRKYPSPRMPRNTAAMKTWTLSSFPRFIVCIKQDGHIFLSLTAMPEAFTWSVVVSCLSFMS